MDMFHLHLRHDEQVWVNPTQIVSLRLDFLPTEVDGGETKGVARATRVTLSTDVSYVDTREPDELLYHLQLVRLGAT